MLSEFSIYTLAFIIRLSLLIYGEWQDKHMEVKFTDVDYFVFTEASKFVVQGESPYRRATYRYSPVLAFILTPNIYLHKAWGKLLFIAFDFVTAIFLGRTLKYLAHQQSVVSIALCLWLFNPITMTVSCRGNAESLMSSLVIGLVYAFVTRNIFIASCLYAVAVHLKIYPVIYSLSVILFLGGNFDQGHARILSQDFVSFFKAKNMSVLSKIFSKQRLKFITVSVTVFLMLSYFMYALYGFDFIEHTYLHHLKRRDVRHNFSLYFYMLYLNSNEFLKFLCFLCQFLMLFVISFVTYEDLPFCFFLLTYTFVSFNKICTSQYFLWYLSLLPLLTPGFLHLELKNILQPVLLWFLGQGIWLYFAYLLEFQGINTFFFIWLSGIFFYLVNIWIIRWCIKNYKFHSLFSSNGLINCFNNKAKKS